MERAETPIDAAVLDCFDFPVTLIRRATLGYALANTGSDTRAIQDFLSHRSIQHTATPSCRRLIRL